MTNFLYSLSVSDWLSEFSWGKVVDLVSNIWFAKVAAVDGNPITISKIVFSLFMLGLGFFASRFISKKLSSFLVQKLNVNVSVQYVIESFTFYTFVLFFFFFALKISNIPLTVFNLIGGAVAVGVGFGSQNIFNNFISGLILMLERPIKIGDFIEIDDSFGRIEDIGPRSTKILSTGNKHIIVPNSKLLENRLYNWTLKDRVIRTCVKVGVAYGSPVSVVIDNLKESLKGVKDTLPNKEVLVLFDDFGDNSLAFELHFFIRIKDHFTEKKACSEVRKKIDHLFAESGVVIAFPQRDVHFYPKNPIEVKINRS